MLGERVYKFTITGKTPLIMSRNDVELADLLQEWQKNPDNKNVSKAGDDRTPPWSWQTRTYHDGQSIAIPCENLMVALRQAGAQMIMKKQKTFKEVSQSGMQMQDEFLPLIIDKKPIEWSQFADNMNEEFTKQSARASANGFRLFVKRARVNQTMHIRVRPRFDVWRCSGTVSVFRDELTADVVKRLFEVAGTVGIGDWRPGCRTPGRFGQFTVDIK